MVGGNTGCCVLHIADLISVLLKLEIVLSARHFFTFPIRLAFLMIFLGGVFDSSFYSCLLTVCLQILCLQLFVNTFSNYFFGNTFLAIFSDTLFFDKLRKNSSVFKGNLCNDLFHKLFKKTVGWLWLHVSETSLKNTLFHYVSIRKHCMTRSRVAVV